MIIAAVRSEVSYQLAPEISSRAKAMLVMAAATLRGPTIVPFLKLRMAVSTSFAGEGHAKQ